MKELSHRKKLKGNWTEYLSNLLGEEEFLSLKA